MVGALQFEVLMEIVGTARFSSAIGLVLLMEAIAVLLGPPGAGLSSQKQLHEHVGLKHSVEPLSLYRSGKGPEELLYY